MFACSLIALLVSASLSIVLCAPVKTGVKLDPVATAEAQQRDDAATRAFTATEIKVLCVIHANRFWNLIILCLRRLTVNVFS